MAKEQQQGTGEARRMGLEPRCFYVCSNSEVGNVRKAIEDPTKDIAPQLRQGETCLDWSMSIECQAKDDSQ